MLLNDPDHGSLIISYLTLRKVVGLLGCLLVPVLIFGSFIFDNTSQVQESVSAYYHTSMRDAFVGIICGISLFLISYHGYERKDAVASKVAGVFALGVSFFPTSQTNNTGDFTSILHYICAGIFFLLLSYMSMFLFTKSSGDMTPEKKKRNRLYKICGGVMIAAVIGIPVTNIPFVYNHVAFIKPTLLLETIALLSFGLSWLTKGEFLLRDQ